MVTMLIRSGLANDEEEEDDNVKNTTYRCNSSEDYVFLANLQLWINVVCLAFMLGMELLLCVFAHPCGMTLAHGPLRAFSNRVMHGHFKLEMIFYFILIFTDSWFFGRMRKSGNTQNCGLQLGIDITFYPIMYFGWSTLSGDRCWRGLLDLENYPLCHTTCVNHGEILFMLLVALTFVVIYVGVFLYHKTSFGELAVFAEVELMIGMIHFAHHESTQPNHFRDSLWGNIKCCFDCSVCCFGKLISKSQVFAKLQSNENAESRMVIKINAFAGLNFLGSLSPRLLVKISWWIRSRNLSRRVFI